MPAILVNDVSPVVSYVATASQTLFAVPFEFFSVADIVVERQGVILTYSPTPANNNQYSVVGENAESGGSITLGGSGANIFDKITIYRNVKIERLANYPETGPMAVRSLNAEQAKQIAMMQQLERDINRTISVPIDESSISLPSSVNRANKILTFDGSGNVATFYSKSLLDNANLTPIANGGTGATTAAGARTNLGASILGSNLFTIANFAQVTFPRFNADNTVSSLNASEFRSAIGAGTGNGSVTSVVGTGTVNGISLSGTISSTGSLTLGGTLSVSGTDFGSQSAKAFFVAPNDSAGTPTFRTILPSDIPTLNQNTTGTASNITGTLAISNGGTAAITADDARTNLGAAKSGINTDITALNNSAGVQAGSPTGGAKGAGTINATGLFVNGVAVGVSGGSVSSVAMTVPSFLSVTGSPITTSGTFDVSLSGTALPAANGGTGLTSPGTAGNVLTSDGTTWVSSPAAAAGGTVSYPQNVQSGNYTLVLDDAGKHIYSANTGAQTITIPTNASVAFPIGTLVTIVNRGTDAIVLDATSVSIFIDNFPVPLPSLQVQPSNSIQILKTAENSWVSIIGNFVGDNVAVTYLLVGGGGGGGRYASKGSGGGGGGGGGFVTGDATLTGLTLYTVTVGAGGTASTDTGDVNGTNGANSTFNSITALGGGGGGGNNAGLAGGSGGGGWWLAGGGAAQQPTSGSGGFGNAGGAGSYQSDFSRITGGSGGGAGALANNSVNGVPQNGGVGKASTITGATVYYAGGGAGGSTYSSGTGGIGGGGNGSAATGTDGGTNTGGGAGSNANGGSGVVIISSAVAAVYTTGSPVVTTSGSNTIYTFTSSGTIAF